MYQHGSVCLQVFTPRTPPQIHRDSLRAISKGHAFLMPTRLATSQVIRDLSPTQNNQHAPFGSFSYATPHAPAGTHTQLINIRDPT